MTADRKERKKLSSDLVVTEFERALFLVADDLEKEARRLHSLADRIQSDIDRSREREGTTQERG